MKMRHSRRLAALLFLLMAGGSAGQQPIALVQSETVVFSGEFARPVQSPVKCDSEGNAYIRPYSPFTSPLLRLSWDGVVTSFLVTSAPGFEKARPSDFAVSPGGDVYELVAPDLDQTFLLRFTKDAQYSSKITLTPSLEPWQLAMFSEGSVFVSGFEWPPLADRGKRTLKLTSKPFTAIYDTSGRMVKRLPLPMEEPQKGIVGAATDPRAAISLASAVTGPDDNVYYLRRSAKPTVFVISSSGEVVRTVSIAPPDKGFEPETIKVAAGTIVVQFVRDNPRTQNTDSLFVVADWQNGRQLAVYTAPIEVGFAFACYTPDGFTFLTTRDKKMAIARAVPH
jgi:hypothetical protein